MTTTHRFTGKGLFYTAAFICIISVVLSPVGLVFLWMAIHARIELTDDAFIYRMLTTKVIPYASIQSITQARPHTAHAHMDTLNTTKALVTVVPLIIEYTRDGKSKRTKLSLNFFERPYDILTTLETRSGRAVVKQ
ncbi:MAG: hypothetical protein AAB384_04235 [Patescibacteria group bacterium]